jgi:hypothetical protein
MPSGAAFGFADRQKNQQGASMWLSLFMAVGLVWGADVPPVEGRVGGTVVNLSYGGRPAHGVPVELRGELDGELVPVARTITDPQGRFRFHGVPLERALTYVAGASVEGVFYGSTPFVLGPQQRSAHVRLTVREAASGESPLVIRRHEVVIQAEQGVLHVTEAMLVDNPTAMTYVGKAGHEQAMSATFVLGIPADFERLTFEEEHWGRNFGVVGGRLVTNVPWEPGERWLRFTYSSRNEHAHRRWERRIDAPCAQIAIRVLGNKTDGIDCSLPRMATDSDGQAAFASTGRALSAGDVVWVDLGGLPVSWMVYARWSALALLAATAAALGLWTHWRRREKAKRSRGGNVVGQVTLHPKKGRRAA